MKLLHVIWNPDPATLARCVDEPVAGSMEMSETAFGEECARRRAAGWQAAVSTPVPISVTARQLFPVLRRTHGITETAIEAALGNPAVIQDPEDRIDALIELRRVYIIERTHPFVSLLAGVFSLTDAQIDAAFIAAEKR